MKLLPLVWAMLWRKKARTLLTFGSIAVAFLLFALLEAFASVFATGARFAGATNLDTLHRFGFIKPLPYAYRSRIEAVPGVAVVTPIVIFPVTFENLRTTIPFIAVDPATIFSDERFVSTPEAIKAFRESRTGMMAGRALAQRMGWKIGDHIPLVSSWIKRKDRVDHWEVDLVGIFDFNEKIFGKGVSAMRAFVRYDYVDEARVDPGEVNLFFVRAASPGQMVAAARGIDEQFQNSANPTQTLSELEFRRQQIAQIGDIGLIITSILSAVFFTLIIVAGNTMMRVFQERIHELAILKALGFTDRAVAGLMTLESVLLCLTAGLAGLLGAWLVMQPLSHAIAEVLPLLRMEPATVLVGALLALFLGLVAGAVPALQSARLNVVEGLSH